MRDCPICGGAADEVGIYENRAATFFKCQICGTGVMSHQAILGLLEVPPESRWCLQAYFRHQPTDPPDDILQTDDLRRIIAAEKSRYGPAEQLDLLLVSVASRSTALNHHSEFDLVEDFPLIWAKGPGEAACLALALVDLKLLEDDPTFLRSALDQLVAGRGANSPPLRLTVRGWQRVQELRAKPPVVAQAFVAMQFAEHTDAIYDAAIRPAIQQAGYKPYRVDRAQHTGRIDDEIVGQIRRSRLMVADFTGQRPGVYFEAGMMLGLGRTVIWLCKESEKGDLHFDVRQYNTIFYSSPERARAALRRRILAVRARARSSGRRRIASSSWICFEIRPAEAGW